VRPGYIDTGGGSAPIAQTTKSYPEGPYGEADPEVGQRIEDLKFDGFVSPVDGTLANQRKVQTLSFSELRNSGKRYAIVHVSAYWCDSCSASALDLSDKAKTVLERDGVIIELLVDGSAAGADPTFKELDNWIVTGGLEVTTVAPGDERVREVFPTREYAYIIELETMEVVWRHFGLYERPTTVWYSVDALLSLYLE